MTEKDIRIKRTRKCLEENLLRLMEQKNINHITVRELTDTAKINRSTFYLHYSDISDVLKHIQQNLLQGFYKKLVEDDAERTIEEDVYHFMEVVVLYLQQHRRTLIVICGKNGDRSFIDTMAEIVHKQADVWFRSLLGADADPQSVELAETFFCNGCVCLLDKWILSGEHMNSRAVLRLLFQLVLTGAYGFVGH